MSDDDDFDELTRYVLCDSCGEPVYGQNINIEVNLCDECKRLEE